MSVGKFNMTQSVQSAIPEPIYRRPESWLTMPTLHATNSEMLWLVAVHDNGFNPIALSVSVTGGYTVDWGDGTITNYASGALAEREYSYAAIDSGTLSSEGYRQVILRVYAQIPANHFTTVDFNRRHSSYSAPYNQRVLDISLRTTTACTTVNDLSYSTNSVFHSLESFYWVGAVNASLANMFRNCYNLRKVTFPAITTTDIQSMFQDCWHIMEVSFNGMTSGTTFSATSLFNGAYNLRSLTGWDGTKVGIASTMFQYNAGLDEVIMSFGASCTSITNLFSNQYGLRKATITVEGNLGTACQGVFNVCRTVKYATLIFTHGTKPTNMGSMFWNADSIIEATVDMSNCTAASSFWTNNFSLMKVNFTEIRVSLTWPVCPMPKNNLEDMFKQCSYRTATTQTITGMHQAVKYPLRSVTVAATLGSAVVTTANTGGIIAGDAFWGPAIASTVSTTVSGDISTNKISWTGHDVVEGQPISFTALGTITGLTTNVMYYAVNVETDLFQVAATVGGAAIDLTGSNSAAMAVRVMVTVVSVVTNTSITLSNKAIATNAAAACNGRTLNVLWATMRGHTING